MWQNTIYSTKAFIQDLKSFFASETNLLTRKWNLEWESSDEAAKHDLQ